MISQIGTQIGTQILSYERLTSLRNICRGPAMAGWPPARWATTEGCPHNLKELLGGIVFVLVAALLHCGLVSQFHSFSEQSLLGCLRERVYV
jgi:hypothetical protein